MYLVFYKTSDVFEVEELLNEKSIKNTVVPTPVQDKAYCGICLEVQDNAITLQLLEEYKYECIK